MDPGEAMFHCNLVHAGFVRGYTLQNVNRVYTEFTFSAMVAKQFTVLRLLCDF